MGDMTAYAPMQSSDLYPTTGDFCDWHYGVHNSYCYTMEIGNAFHEYPEDIAHISVRNVGVPWYMIEIADDPRFRAVHGIENMSARYWLQTPSEVDIPSKGDINFDLCLDQYFPFSINKNSSFLSWSSSNPRDNRTTLPHWWRFVDWNKAAFTIKGESCELKDGTNGTILTSSVPIPDTSVGKLQYRAQLRNHKWGHSPSLIQRSKTEELLRINDALSRASGLRSYPFSCSPSSQPSSGAD